jgi:ethanolamine phosphate phosphodiesterase
MWKSKILILFALFFFNEFLIYRLQIFSWTKLKCTNKENCVKILFVADPQILGEINEKSLARFDSDRHLRENYRVTLKFVKPDAIIFLGDLMDEGSIASDRQLLNYHKRFMKIFPIPENSSAIYIAGDNDVGGEGGEKVDTRHFRALFGGEMFWNLRDIAEVYHFNRNAGIYPEISNNTANLVKIAVGHYSLMESFDSKVRRALEAIKPNVIFSAHHHKSMLYTGTFDYFKSRFIKNSISFDLHNFKELIEIQVPSINYRMGSLQIGFGQAVIEDETLHYSPLFIISRFYQFFIYFVIALIYVMNFCCCHCVSKLRHRSKIRYQKLSSV